MKKNRFFPQVKLVLQSLPYVFEEEVFALKGGSAINFFFRDLPRLSVDIDLTYLPIESREVSLGKIEAALKRIANRIRSDLPGVSIQEGRINNPNMVNKIFVKNAKAQIKVEPNLVIRGSVFPTEKHALSFKAQEIFELFVEAQTVSFADLFGGKICAALDRQHPRDIYDIKFLLDNEGITEQIRKGFLIYLISHSRPIHELLEPVLKDFKDVYESEFQGMTDDNVSYDDLVEVRSVLISLIKEILTQEEKDFLVSFKKGEPNWNQLGVDGVEKLPAVKWKIINIRKMSKEKKSEFFEKMINYFNG
ncbi:MAG: nucleotidyl transferase AbiEii/AbiGii toxin family protein [Candidatus Omnitrophica bacterium]|nr:nucleotidyl transferase AbiEii/AbiGii toxin family protein [Candidatus Omnitrophota bacterium]MCF7878912.1 nucleotidyl transferase AbiEii/AbiGii toxin family protein [Candidatus Omnitrophota bacterium]MCF7888320.1 nucleotidyl transferase AbiEii/AbiGii toxin family protein [Candidatus Omnitrophota bacterium]